MATEPSFPSNQTVSQPLSPLAQRLLAALRHMAEEHDELQMVIRGFERHMRKRGIPDDEIRGGLESIREHINIILDDNAHTRAHA